MNWEIFLAVKDKLEKEKNLPLFFSVIPGDEVVVKYNEVVPSALFTVFFSKDQGTQRNHFFSDQPLSIKCKNKAELAPGLTEEILLYLPYALLPYYARKEKRCFAISHFAQTLDGKIATCSGDSKWIGNKENLVHAHKMRAMCDAIMVGSNTLAVDNPSLNVRHVKGNDPVKVVLGGDSLDLGDFKAIDVNTILFCQNHLESVGTCTKVSLTKNPGYNTVEILRELYLRGLHSVYIEGGSYTTSKFLQQNALDQVQVHISSKILGSGTSSFTFEGANSVSEAKKFTHVRFMSMGDEVMFIGNLAKDESN